MPKSQPIERPWVPCGFIGCGNRAILRRVKSGMTGYTNLCKEHYDNQKLDEANKFCEEHGLDSIKKKKEFIFKNLGKFKRMP